MEGIRLTSGSTHVIKIGGLDGIGESNGSRFQSVMHRGQVGQPGLQSLIARHCQISITTDDFRDSKHRRSAWIASLDWESLQRPY